VPTSAAIERASRAELDALQRDRLRVTVGRLLTHVAPIRDRLHQAGVHDPRDITHRDDIAQLPFTVKDDLRAHYPLGLLAVPRAALTRVHASSGTGGQPTVVGYTAHDLDVWSEVMERSLLMAGVRPGMVVHNAYGYGLFTGGLGFHQGAERLGATVIPVSGGVTGRQARLLRDLGGQALACTPSYALHIAQAVREAGIAVDELNLEVGLFGAEPWTEAMRGQIEAALGLTAINFYGLSEVVGPGVAAECREARDGLHVHEDHFLVEVVDPDTGAPLPDGEEGELVFTTLTKEALPVIRYRTRDLTRLLPPTARAMRRMGKIVGRSDDMLIIRGVNLFPTQIEEIVLGHGQLSGQYQLVVSRDGNLDAVEVRCEVLPGHAGANRDELAGWLRQRIKTMVGITTTVNVGLPDTLERTLVGKARRVVDQRKK
jgi:phenylacetate-CoA ligase